MLYPWAFHQAVAATIRDMEYNDFFFFCFFAASVLKLLRDH